MCEKEGYTLGQLKWVKKSINKHSNVKLRKYLCDDCFKWHLTSRINDL